MDATPAPAPPSSTDPIPGVCFARRSDRSVFVGGDDSLARLCLVVAVGLLGIVALWVTYQVARLLFGTVAPYVAIGLGFVGLIALPAVAVSMAGYNTPRSWRGLRAYADENTRIHVLCPRSHVERHHPLEDTDFEPEYHRLLLVTPRSWLDGAVVAAVFLAAWPINLALKNAGLPTLGSFHFYALVPVAFAAVAMLRHTYLRISPGRLDVLRFTVWRERADVCRTYDLRTQPLVIDPRRRRILVGGRPVEHWAPGHEREQARERRAMAAAAARLYKPRHQPVAVSFLGTLAPSEVASQLLRAAISTAPTPNLPPDRLHD